jgi:chemosensory pili system protein ChpC
MNTVAQEVRSLVAPIHGGSVMLPSSVVAEVIDFSKPLRYKDSPAWVLGEVRWNNWSVPVVSLAVLSGKANSEKTTSGNRMLVVKSLSGSVSAPYFGILIEGIPRMLRVTPSSLEKPRQLTGHPCVFREVTVGEEKVLIPDLEKIAETLEDFISEQD